VGEKLIGLSGIIDYQRDDQVTTPCSFRRQVHSTRVAVPLYQPAVEDFYIPTQSPFQYTTYSSQSAIKFGEVAPRPASIRNALIYSPYPEQDCNIRTEVEEIQYTGQAPLPKHGRTSPKAIMATFLMDLMNSIFTPGPTPSIIIATNTSFAALQLVLLILLILTYSVHFVVLSSLCAGLWWAINWFVTELEAANHKEKEAKQLREMRKGQDDRGSEASGTETEGAGNQTEVIEEAGSEGLLRPDGAQGALKKRRSLGKASSGDLSTDSEWDKVSEAGDLDK